MGFNLNNHTKLTVGRLARESGLSLTTVRYYQQRGLLRRPERPPTGSFRFYGEGDLQRLCLIKQAQELGFTLAEIAELIVHVDGCNCDEIKALADRKLRTLSDHIRLLNRQRRTLGALLAQGCTDCGDRCPLIQKLRCLTPPSTSKKEVQKRHP